MAEVNLRFSDYKAKIEAPEMQAGFVHGLLERSSHIPWLSVIHDIMKPRPARDKSG